MAISENTLAIEHGRPRRDGKTKYAAKLGDKTLHVAWIDQTKAEDRAAFAEAVAKDRPGVDAEDIEDALLQDAGSNEGEEKERSQASRLIDIATLGCELWHTADRDAYATLDLAHREHWRVRSKGFRQWLAREYFREHRSAANSDAVQSAINTLEGLALFAQPGDHMPASPGQPAPGAEYPVYVRLAEHGGTMHLDLCDADWRTVIITPDGWRVGDDRLVRFRRARAMLPLPEPVRGGTVELLRPFVNVSEDEWPLLVGWLLAAMRPRGPYPVLCLHGEQGSAKSTTARALRALVDPSIAPLRAEPKDPRDLMIAATNSAIVAFDNLSRVPAWLSDALCRLSTGGGFATRELFTDSEEAIFDAMRPVILTGIEELATRSDLLDRAVLLTLPTIPEDRRRPESEFWAAFDAMAPAILGALLTAVSGAMRRLPTLTLPRLPRMADFALWATAGERAMGLADGAFLAAYTGNRQGANEVAIESSPVSGPLLALMESRAEWGGTASDLLAELEVLADERTKRLHGWPKGARALSGCVKRLAPNLRRAGIDVDTTGHVGRGKDKRKAIRLARVVGEICDPTGPVCPNVWSTGADAGLQTADSASQTLPPVPPDKAGVGADGVDGAAKCRPHSAGGNGDAANPAEEGMLV